MKRMLGMICLATLTLTTPLIGCSEDVTEGVAPLEQRISQSAVIDQARAFIGTWSCVAQNTPPGAAAFESQDRIDIAPAAGDAWVRWEFEQLVTPDPVPPARGADLWGADGQSQGLVRYRVDNSGGHGPLYASGFATDGDGYTLTWGGEVYVAAADGLVPLEHTFTISDAADAAGYFDEFDTEVLVGTPEGMVSVITGHCERG